MADEVVDRFRSYLAKNPAWGSLHLVLGDGNVQDSHVQFCLDQARAEDDGEGVELARLLLQMSKTQRRKLGNL